MYVVEAGCCVGCVRANAFKNATFLHADGFILTGSAVSAILFDSAMCCFVEERGFVDWEAVRFIWSFGVINLVKTVFRFVGYRSFTNEIFVNVIITLSSSEGRNVCVTPFMIVNDACITTKSWEVFTAHNRDYPKQYY